MEMKWTPEEIQRIVNDAMKRAATDTEFRKLVLRNPNGAVQLIAGKAVPASIKVRVLERDTYDATIVLPDPVSKTGELSDAELEQVAGGSRSGSGNYGGGLCGLSCAVSLPT